MLYNYTTIILYSPKQINQQTKKRKRWSNEKLDVKEQMKKTTFRVWWKACRKSKPEWGETMNFRWCDEKWTRQMTNEWGGYVQ